MGRRVSEDATSRGRPSQPQTLEQRHSDLDPSDSRASGKVPETQVLEDFQAKYLKLRYSSTWVSGRVLSEGPRTEYPYTRYLEE